MSIDWDQFDQDLGDAIDQGKQQTDDELASKISSLTRMTDAEVKELFPKAADAKALSELMKIVDSSASQNEKINQIQANSAQFAGILLKLSSKLI